MGLSEIDDEKWVPTRPIDSVEKEEMRRAWLLVWELDIFASMPFRKPFSIDRKRMAVKLPISDQAGYAEGEVDSAEMMTTSDQIWKSLQGNPNQDARSWFLLANQCMSNVLDLLQRGRDSYWSIKSYLRMRWHVSRLRFLLSCDLTQNY